MMYALYLSLGLIGLGIVFYAWPIVFFEKINWAPVEGRVQFFKKPHIVVEDVAREQWRLYALFQKQNMNSKITIDVFPSKADNIFLTDAQILTKAQINLNGEFENLKMYRHPIFIWLEFVRHSVSNAELRRTRMHLIFGLIIFLFSCGLVFISYL